MIAFPSITCRRRRSRQRAATAARHGLVASRCWLAERTKRHRVFGARRDRRRRRRRGRSRRGRSHRGPCGWSPLVTAFVVFLPLRLLGFLVLSLLQRGENFLVRLVFRLDGFDLIDVRHKTCLLWRLGCFSLHLGWLAFQVCFYWAFSSAQMAGEVLGMS